MNQVGPCVAALDFSLTATGVASSDGWVKTVGLTGVTVLPVALRQPALESLAEELYELASLASLVAVEMFTVHRMAKQSGGVGERGYLYYRTVGLLVAAGIPIVEIPTSSLKLYATGKGSAPKQEVSDAVARRWPQFITHGDDNMCDAATMVAMGCDWLGYPLSPVPQKNRAALTNLTPAKKGKPATPAIHWPTMPTAA
jgi:Holliday junction resolvasome RuvABC endonuclease subunit